MRGALQGLTEIDPEVTVTSIDGLGAFDMISRGAMLQGLRCVSGAALPLTRMFYGGTSEYLWEMDNGQVHRIPQGEGGEQGDPMMPLFAFLVSMLHWKPPTASLSEGNVHDTFIHPMQQLSGLRMVVFKTH